MIITLRKEILKMIIGGISIKEVASQLKTIKTTKNKQPSISLHLLKAIIQMEVQLGRIISS